MSFKIVTIQNVIVKITNKKIRLSLYIYQLINKMVSNYDRFSNCTAPTLNKSNYTSHSSQLNLYVDNAPVTPWVRGEVIHEGMIPIDKGYIPKNVFGRRYYGNNNNNMKFYNPGTVHGDSRTVNEGADNHYQYYNRKRGRPYNRHYYHDGQRGYYNNNNNHNNHRSKYPFTCSPSVYPLSRSQSTYNIGYNTTYNTTDNNNGRSHRYSNCGYLLNNEQPTDEYIDDCLLTDIEQYQLKLDINDNQKINQLNNIDKVKTTTIITSSPPPTSSSSTSSSSSPSTDSDFVSNDISQLSSLSLSTSASTSSSTSSSSSSSTNQSYQITDSHFYNEFKQLQYKSKSSLNLSTSSTIVYNINNKDEDDNHEDYTDVNDDIQDTEENSMKSMEYNNNQEDGKSGNINDYLTLVWDDLPETLE
ncbi:unnamed protein product [Schistosoma rodhaini]|uniref:Uncharacterized protein n=1 Tax=Schistosoma rodhaini TaxID=6188 RepID=A0AA85FEW5_9TREM|nr:unnamed protein product [Schistosoma rodhaini]